MQTIRQVLGFDFGLSRIGVAIGQGITGTASPLGTVLALQGEPKNWSEVDALIKTWRPDALLVGIPLLMDGTAQALTKNAQDFARILAERYHLPIYEVDERLTTKAARTELSEHRALVDSKFKKMNHIKVDALAACLIVETWLAEYSSAP